MALQGTIDAVPITDVLGLIGTARRSGQLVVEGDRGTDSIWIDEGAVVGIDVQASTALGVVTNLLRHREASYCFEPDERVEPAQAIDAVPLDECLVKAMGVLEAWREVELVVPSMAHRITLAPTIDRPVSVDPAAWSILVQSVAAPTVDEVARSIGVDDFDASSAVAGLVGVGLLQVIDPAEGSSGGFGAASGPAAALVADPFPERFPIDDLLTDSDREDPAAWSEPAPSSSPERDAASSAFASLSFESASFDSASFDSGSADAALAAPQSADAEDVSTKPYDLADVGALDGSPFGSVSLDARGLDVAAFDGHPLGSIEPGTPPAFGAEPEPAGADGSGGDATDEVLRQMSRLSPEAADAIAAALGTDANPSRSPAEPVADHPGVDTGSVSYLQSF